MYQLFHCAELNALRHELFSDRLTHCRSLLTFVDKPQTLSNAIFFQQLQHHALPASWTAIQQAPRKAKVSLWQRDWLNSFMMHWVWFLHKYRLHLALSEPHTALRLNDNGSIQGFLVNVSFTPIYRVETQAQILHAYRQLKQFLAPIFTRLTAYSRLNQAVFWHNCANLIEFSLKELEAEKIDVTETYQQILLNKKWDAYEWSPFYNAVEYRSFPELPFPQPVRMRKVCCHAFLDPNNTYCGNCPKLKTLPTAALNAWIAQWGK